MLFGNGTTIAFNIIGGVLCKVFHEFRIMDWIYRVRYSYLHNIYGVYL